MCIMLSILLKQLSKIFLLKLIFLKRFRRKFKQKESYFIQVTSHCQNVSKASFSTLSLKEMRYPNLSLKPL